MTTDLTCLPCRNTALATLPDREQIVRTDHWRVAHAFDSALAGWLVLIPTHHITSFADLSATAAAELGSLIHRLSRALAHVVGCVKTYQMQFSEHEQFAHLHVHLVPRAADLAAELRGPGIFAFLGADQADRVSDAEMDQLARKLRSALTVA